MKTKWRSRRAEMARIDDRCREILYVEFPAYQRAQADGKIASLNAELDALEREMDGLLAMDPGLPHDRIDRAQEGLNPLDPESALQLRLARRRAQFVALQEAALRTEKNLSSAIVGEAAAMKLEHIEAELDQLAPEIRELEQKILQGREEGFQVSKGPGRPAHEGKLMNWITGRPAGESS